MHEGHRERMRQRIEKYGLDNLSDHEFLEYLLYFTNKRKNTNGTGHLLMDAFGSLDKVFDASSEALCSVEGVGPISAQFLSLIPQIARRYLIARQGRGRRYISRERMVEYLEPQFFGASVELCVVMCLDANYSLIHDEIVSTGESRKVGVETKDVIALAVKYKAAYVIVAHNHLNNECRPSEEDFTMTRHIRIALSHIDVKLLDHLIICPSREYYSFAEHGS